MDSVHDCITPIIKISSFFGLLSIKIIKDNGKLTAKFHKHYILLPITYMILTTLLIYEMLLSASTLEKSKYGIGVLYIGVLFMFIGNISALYTIYFTNTLCSPFIAKVINTISKMDKLMKIMINKIDYMAHFKYEIYMISSGLLIVFVQIMLHYLTFNAQQKLLNKRLLFLLAFPIITRTVVEYQYIIFIKILCERFIILNKELYSLGKYKSHDILVIQTIQENNCKEWATEETKYIDTQLRSIELFMKIHDILCETGNMISRVFSVQILVIFATHLISEIFTVFYTYFEMVYHHYIPALHWFGWIITINLEMLHITAICHQTTREARKTASIINKLFLSTQLNKMVKEKLCIFSQQIHHTLLKFSACGLFSIDGRLFFMVTCASSTYLLVMFQYQQGIEIHCLNRNTT